MPDHTSTNKNAILTIILVLLILITSTMIINFSGMQVQSRETANIPQCVGSNDLNLVVGNGSRSNNAFRSNRDGQSSNFREQFDGRVSDRGKCVQNLIKSKVGNYSDGSIHPELEKEMIRRARLAEVKKLSEKVDSQNPKGSNSNKQAGIEKKNDKPESNKIKLCIYHMQGCGHCHDIMDVKQQSGKTKFEELCNTFKDKPNVEILDFKNGRDPEASKFRAFPVIRLVKFDGSSQEYNGRRSSEDMARFVVQNM